MQSAAGLPGLSCPSGRLLMPPVRRESKGGMDWKDEEHLIPENVQWTSGTYHVVLCCYGYWNAVAPSLGRRIHLSSLSYAINLLQSQEWIPRQLNPRGCQDAEMPLLASQTASHIPSKG